MTAAAGEQPDKDQSMDDILASIRRIMLDEQARLQDSPGTLAYAAGRAPGKSADPVLILDQSMVVEDTAGQSRAGSREEQTAFRVPSKRADPPRDPADNDRSLDAQDANVTGTVPADAVTADVTVPVALGTDALARTPAASAQAAPQELMSAQAIEALMAPAAAAAASASVEALLKQLSEERLTGLRPSPPPSPSIEDVVRSELRPFLKAWLDEHLPPMIERLVRVEITRLIGRSGF